MELIAWDDWIESSRSLLSNNPTVVKSSTGLFSAVVDVEKTNIVSKIKNKYPFAFERLITEIRQRYYSIRTEQVYVS